MCLVEFSKCCHAKSLCKNILIIRHLLKFHFLSQENDAVFVMTNMIITPRQHQGLCPEDQEYKDAHCKTDADCVEGREVVI